MKRRIIAPLQETPKDISPEILHPVSNMLLREDLEQKIKVMRGMEKERRRIQEQQNEQRRQLEEAFKSLPIPRILSGAFKRFFV